MQNDAIVQAVLKAITDSPEWKYLCSYYVCKCRTGTNAGKPGPCPQNKPKPAKNKPKPTNSILSPTTFAAREQRHAERQQEHLADEINHGADAIPGNAPADVERVERGGHLTAIEVKTKLRGKAVRMTNAAQARKLLRLEQHRSETGKDGAFHTVAVDHRGAYKTEPDLDVAPTFPVYYKRGAGSFGLHEMEKVLVPERLNELLAMPDDKLPEKARPTTRGFWGRYNGTKDKRKREAMLKDALKKEKAQATGGKP